MTNTKKFHRAGVALAVLMAAGGPGRVYAQLWPSAGGTGGQTATQDGKFYCNMGALNPAERAHHKQLTDKLIAVRNKIVETPRGYEFQFSPSSTSLAELVDWVAAERKCCPFFNFHIDLEQRGNLLCLGLTGEEGIKAVIRTEFRVPVE